MKNGAEATMSNNGEWVMPWCPNGVPNGKGEKKSISGAAPSIKASTPSLTPSGFECLEETYATTYPKSA